MVKTKIFIHGLLGELFTTSIEVYIKNLFFVTKDIDCNFPGFCNKIAQLSKEGMDYSIVIDGCSIKDEKELMSTGNFKEIHIIPTLSGAGVLIPLLLAVGQALIPIAISVGLSYLAMKFLNKTDQKQSYQAVGGSASQVSAGGKSNIFGNVVNVSSQGESIPIGYGRMRVGSKVIATSIRSYTKDQNFYSAS